jgi:hypothetical protein
MVFNEQWFIDTIEDKPANHEIPPFPLLLHYCDYETGQARAPLTIGLGSRGSP